MKPQALRRAVAAGCLLAAVHVSVAQHAGDVWIGVDGNGQLAVSGFDVQRRAAILPAVNGILKGFADDNPGFDRLTAPEPADDPNLFPLASGAEIWLEVVAMDPALRLIDNAYQILAEPGDDTLLGGSTLHVHMNWHIDSTALDYDPNRLHWRATLVLHDNGSTDYDTSEPITIAFADTPHLPGDVNDDGVVDTYDIDAFISALAGDPAHTRAQRCAADANFDGIVDTYDIDAFVALLLQPD